MNTKKKENYEHAINEQFPFADTPEGRRKLYERAVQFSERFIYYSPDPTVEDEPIVKFTFWDDESGKRHYEYHEMTVEENKAQEIAFEITRIYESHHDIGVYLNTTGKDYLSDAEFEQAVKDMNTLIGDNGPSRLLANEHGKSNKVPEERNNTGLSNEQISVLRDMSAIRKAKQEPEYNRLAAFEQQKEATKNFSLDDPIIKDGQQVYVNEHQIRTGQDLIDALVDAYGPQPQLYGFEVYEEPDADIDKGNIEEDLEP
jgi:hypothetical protein